MMAGAFDDPAKAEIRAMVRALNDAWTIGDADALARYCHSNMVAVTGNDRPLGEGAVACIADWKGFAQSPRIPCWMEIEPLIHISRHD